ncbi:MULTISPECIES: helix-turn-helix domain-containing protein [Giesbergeria]|uniref:Helix-turn-helix domain-containing protein n=1 Tax=Giesbergeria sinuosa TaxID=80883 RepID=A0ABV9QCU6_9BURK
MNPIQRAIDITGGVSGLAAVIGASSPAIYSWRSGARTFPAELCPSIEKATSGVVRCEDLRPDVDWAYLRGTAKPTTSPTGA